MTVNGVSLFYIEQGEGEPVLMVHGVLGDYRDWSGLLPALGAGRRGIAYSRRNAHPNRILPEQVACGCADHASDLAELAVAVGAAPAHVVADSYGGAVALLVALHRPEIVRTLVLSEPSVPSLLASNSDGQPLARTFDSFLEERVLRAFHENDPELAVEFLIDYIEGSDGVWARIPPANREVILSNSTALHRELQAGFPLLTREELQRLRVPVLLLRGDQGPDILHRCTEALAECIPGSRMTTLPGLTHAALPHSEAYREAVLGFLDEHRV